MIWVGFTVRSSFLVMVHLLDPSENSLGGTRTPLLRRFIEIPFEESQLSGGRFAHTLSSVYSCLMQPEHASNNIWEVSLYIGYSQPISRSENVFGVLAM